MNAVRKTRNGALLQFEYRPVRQIMLKLLSQFWRDRGGNFAILTGLLAPLLLMAGRRGAGLRVGPVVEPAPHGRRQRRRAAAPSVKCRPVRTGARSTPRR